MDVGRGDDNRAERLAVALLEHSGSFSRFADHNWESMCGNVIAFSAEHRCRPPRWEGAIRTCPTCLVLQYYLLVNEWGRVHLWPVDYAPAFAAIDRELPGDARQRMYEIRTLIEDLTRQARVEGPKADQVAEQIADMVGRRVRANAARGLALERGRWRPLAGADPGRAEPGRAEPGRAEPGRAEPGRAEPGRAEPGCAELAPPATMAGAPEAQCSVCFETAPMVTLVPCGHTRACWACIDRLPRRECPTCREPIVHAVRALM